MWGDRAYALIKLLIMDRGTIATIEYFQVKCDVVHWQHNGYLLILLIILSLGTVQAGQWRFVKTAFCKPSMTVYQKTQKYAIKNGNDSLKHIFGCTFANSSGKYWKNYSLSSCSPIHPRNKLGWTPQIPGGFRCCLMDVFLSWRSPTTIEILLLGCPV